MNNQNVTNKYNCYCNNYYTMWVDIRRLVNMYQTYTHELYNLIRNHDKR